MKSLTIDIQITSLTEEELTLQERTLLTAAKEATQRSYAPYSGFSVGAAVLLSNGEIVTGTNQENAAYPSGICAERTALFYANSQYPDASVLQLAVVARNEHGFLPLPIPPCGSCRQVILETENRYKTPITIFLYGEKEIYRLEGIKQLLPLSFTTEYLDK